MINVPIYGGLFGCGYYIWLVKMIQDNAEIRASMCFGYSSGFRDDLELQRC